METTVKLETLKPDLTFKSDLMLDEEYILLPVGTPVTEELIKNGILKNLFGKMNRNPNRKKI